VEGGRGAASGHLHGFAPGLPPTDAMLQGRRLVPGQHQGGVLRQSEIS